MDGHNDTSFAAVVCGKLDELKASVAEVKGILTGGVDPSKGLIIRVDRLEQSAGVVRKVFWVVVGALVTPASIGGFIWYLMSNHKH